MGGIANPAKEYFKDGQWGWDGSVWRKLPLVFGYSDGWSEDPTGAAVGAGNAIATTTPVPAGSIYVLQVASIDHDAAADKSAMISAYVGGVTVPLFDDPLATPHVWYPVICEVTLKEDDYVTATVKAPGDGKSCWLRVCGYKMKVAE